MSNSIQSKKTKITLAVGTVLAGMAFAPAAWSNCTVTGTTYVVDTATDITNGVDGLTTFREAVVLANANPNCDNITFAPALNNQTITLTEAPLIRLTQSANIVGPGSGLLTVTNNGAANDAFNMSASDIGLSGITFDGTGGDPANSGVWIDNNAKTSATATVEDIVVKNTRGLRIYPGSSGTVSVTGSSFVSNTNAGLEFYGGSMDSLVVDNVTVAGNADGSRLNAETVVIRNSRFANNTSSFLGAIQLEGFGGGNISIVNTSITGNSATSVLNENFMAGSSGGGIQISSASNNYTLNIVQSTISGNSANGAGGGIYFGDRGASADVNIVQSTISNNTSVYGGGIYSTNTGADVKVKNSVISGNTASSADVTDADVGVATGMFTAGNVSSSYSFFGVNFTNVTDSGSGGSFLNGGDAMLAALAAGANGQQVHIPAAGSMLIDMGDPATPTCVGEAAVTDQVGNQRVVNSRVDIGSIESGSSVALAELCGAASGGGGGSSFSAYGLAFLTLIAGFVGIRRKSDQ